MIKYNNTNNASTTLTAGISASSTTLIVENGDILPTAPFLLTLEHFDNEKVTVREIVKCIAKAGNILTIQRGAGTCVQDDSASTKEQGNSAHSFSVGDCASIYWTSEQVQDIQNEIEKKLNIDDFQAGTYVYGATSTETDAYSITIPGTLTSYAVGQVFRFMADVDNEGNATLNINGLGAVEIRKNHDKILDNGDIEAGQIVEVAYDGTYFQMDSQVATVVDVASLGNTQYKTGVAGEDLQAGDVCCLVDFENDYFEMKTVGQTEASVDYEVIGNGESSNSITLWLGRRGNTSGEDLVIELIDTVDNVETVIASSQVARSGLTEDTTVETVCSWGESIETEKGKVYTLRLRTYDNTFDADKGFYYNKNPSNMESDYWRGWLTEIYTNIKRQTTLNQSTTNYHFKQNTVICTNATSYRTPVFNLNGQNNTIRVNTRYYRDVIYLDLTINGQTTTYSSETNIYYFNNAFYIGDSKIDIPQDDYVYQYITGEARITVYDITLPPKLEGQAINATCSSLGGKRFYKGGSTDTYINTTTALKGQDATFETGGISNLFTGKKGTLKYYGNIDFGTYRTDGMLKYAPKYYIPYPTVGTPFFIGKDAFISISNPIGTTGTNAQYTIDRSGDEQNQYVYRTWVNTSGTTSGSVIFLQGGYEYTISSGVTIYDFYLVD